MKKIFTLFVLLCCFYSCKTEEKKAPVNPLTVPFSERPTPQLPNTNNSTVNVLGGAHYICPKKCEGGTSSIQGTACPVCKTPLAHNQGFHNTQNNNSNSPISIPATPPTSGPNAAGQYHYTCSNGCTIGSDNSGQCKNCGGELVHNAAFHS
ncbi:hypothetical protein [uncultured Tenacibaculum sp.]|uniref:hypothetical protein n=1 Tax=uncultured Tenacibaculum sp. TaxID=174713 RepID=UPI0026279408|nr:hypothetical protein [uncultured Tenacibaculum sp.]